MTWDYVQYPAGLAELGLDVYYIEDTRLWPVFQTEAGSGDCTPNVEHLRTVMESFGLAGRWCYRDEVTGNFYGLSRLQVAEICRSADIFLNISCSTPLREEYLRIPVRALVDSDPMFTQVQYASQEAFTPGDPAMRELVDAHTHLFTFGENTGQADCRVPLCGKTWIATRQPVCLRHWPVSPVPPRSAYTTLMNWRAGRPLLYGGEHWGQKDVTFPAVMELPSLVPEAALAVAVGRTAGQAFPAAAARAAGWCVLDPDECARDWRAYRAFLSSSRGEFAVAKEAYVKARTGWFSCRSACYLASGRPVIAQDTGWSKYYPTGQGLFAFTGVEEAAQAMRAIEHDPAAHAGVAREIATEYFESNRVLSRLLQHLGG